jgi:hypothetical protein
MSISAHFSHMLASGRREHAAPVSRHANQASGRGRVLLPGRLEGFRDRQHKVDSCAAESFQPTERPDEEETSKLRALNFVVQIRTSLCSQHAKEKAHCHGVGAVGQGYFLPYGVETGSTESIPMAPVGSYPESPLDRAPLILRHGKRPQISDVR